MKLTNANIHKAGAYVLYRGRYAFMVGFGSESGASTLRVVRLGGHREQGESPEQCAIRELKEECSLDVILYDAPCTYLVRDGEYEPEKDALLDNPRPILAKEDANLGISVMYLAYGHGTLAPAMETQGILLLSREDIHVICSGPTTLDDCLRRGATVLMIKPLPLSTPLHPAFQIKFLHELFERDSKCLECFEGCSTAESGIYTNVRNE